MLHISINLTSITGFGMRRAWYWFVRYTPHQREMILKKTKVS